MGFGSDIIFRGVKLFLFFRRDGGARQFVARARVFSRSSRSANSGQAGKIRMRSSSTMLCFLFASPRHMPISRTSVCGFFAPQSWETHGADRCFTNAVSIGAVVHIERINVSPALIRIILPPRGGEIDANDRSEGCR
jgi:hypothetical protein